MNNLIIGIAGGAGSGKTTLALRLKERFGEDEVRLISLSLIHICCCIWRASCSSLLRRWCERLLPSWLRKQTGEALNTKRPAAVSYTHLHQTCCR